MEVKIFNSNDVDYLKDTRVNVVFAKMALEHLLDEVALRAFGIKNKCGVYITPEADKRQKVATTLHVVDLDEEQVYLNIKGKIVSTKEIYKIEKI